jgi:inner membrane protein
MEILYWYWWVLAFAFLILEMLTPGFFFMWLAVAGATTGVIVLALPGLNLNLQIMLFSIFAVLALGLWRVYGKKWPTETDQPLLNKRGAQYIGRTFLVHEAIINGQGKIKVDDGLWKVSGEDCPAQSKVRVIGVKGTVLEVERIG